MQGEIWRHFREPEARQLYQYSSCPLLVPEPIRCPYPFPRHRCGDFDGHPHPGGRLSRSVLTNILLLFQCCRSGTPTPFSVFYNLTYNVFSRCATQHHDRHLHTTRLGHDTYLSNAIFVLPGRKHDHVIRANDYADLAFETAPPPSSKVTVLEDLNIFANIALISSLPILTNCRELTDISAATLQSLPLTASATTHDKALQTGLTPTASITALHLRPRHRTNFTHVPAEQDTIP